MPRHTYVRAQQHTGGDDPGPEYLHASAIYTVYYACFLHSTEKKHQGKSGPCRHGRQYTNHFASPIMTHGGFIPWSTTGISYKGPYEQLKGS